jgi:hypothetical protein
MTTKKLLVYVKFEEGAEAAHLNTKFTVPKSWRPGPVRKLLAFAVETYNGKHADTLLDKDRVHFECAGEILGLDDIIDQTIQPKAELKLVSGAPPLIGSARQRIVDETKRKEEEAEAKRLFAVGKVKCQNFGCAQLFDPNDNQEGSCHHHVSPPFFHDCKKGWTCCRGKTAMDWDDFQKLPTCAVGKHSATPPKAKPKPKEETCVPCAAPTTSIESYNANEGKAAPTAAKSFARATGTKAKPKVTKYEDGTYRCQNKGCQARFRKEDNHAKACTYHKGTPVFHETLKWWGCCPDRKKMDFDDFLAVPGCASGPHWTGEGEPPAVEEIVEASEAGFDLG